MAFTYDIASPDPDIARLSQVRIELGDEVEDSGVLQGGKNLQDEAIEHYLTANSNNVVATVAALSAVIWRHWLTAADVAVGPRRESLSQVAKAWQSLAGGGEGVAVSGGTSFVTQPVRVDGYSENA